MIRLRPYEENDGNYIMNWITDERCHFKWCVNNMVYPLSKEVMKAYEDAFKDGKDGWLLTAVDENNIPVGHMAIKRKKGQEDSVHFAYIVVDSAKRKSGIGKEMVSQAAKYTFEELNKNHITLCVFENNQIAHNCYRTVGFKDIKFHERCVPYKDEIWSYHEMELVK